MLLHRTALFLFLIFVSINGNAWETEVSNFDNLFALKLSLNQNFLSYNQTRLDYNLDSNRPMDIGIGFSYKDFSLGFSVSVPFMYDKNYSKSKSFDINGDYFFGNSFIFDGYIKYYNGFHDDSGYNVDLEIFTLGFSGEYIFNKNHSLRSVYNLDRKQPASNGSFLIGGGGFFVSANLNDGVLISGKELHFGPNFGYSYTWIIKKDFFINLVAITGINGIKSEDVFYFGMHVLPKLSLGYHGKKWSINIFSNISLLISNIGGNNEYTLTSGKSGFSFSRRI